MIWTAAQGYSKEVERGTHDDCDRLTVVTANEPDISRPSAAFSQTSGSELHSNDAMLRWPPAR
jgi:hypothetical protein